MSDSAGLDVDLGVRAEHVRLGNGGVTATVTVCQPQGPATDVTVAWEGGTLIARVPGFAEYEPGKTVTVDVDPAGRNWFDRATGQRVEIGLPAEVGKEAAHA